MEQWEYWTAFVWADIEHQGAAEYIKKKWPDWNPAKYAPQTMIPELDGYGEAGWELVHMEPIQSVGPNGDVGFPTGGGSAGTTRYSNVYFCVFKRKK
jgi:uncharacterized protein YbdZ (MbtH family)